MTKETKNSHSNPDIRVNLDHMGEEQIIDIARGINKLLPHNLELFFNSTYHGDSSGILTISIRDKANEDDACDTPLITNQDKIWEYILECFSSLKPKFISSEPFMEVSMWEGNDHDTVLVRGTDHYIHITLLKSGMY